MKSESELMAELQAERQRRKVKASKKHRRKVAFWEMLAPRSTSENLKRRKWLRRNSQKVMATFRAREERDRRDKQAERRQECEQRRREITERRRVKTEGGCYGHSC